MARGAKYGKDLVIGIPDTANLKEARVNADQIGAMVKEIAGRGKAVQQVPAVRVKGSRDAARAAGVDAGFIDDPIAWTKTIWRRAC